MPDQPITIAEADAHVAKIVCDYLAVIANTAAAPAHRAAANRFKTFIEAAPHDKLIRNTYLAASCLARLVESISAIPGVRIDRDEMLKGLNPQQP